MQKCSNNGYVRYELNYSAQYEHRMVARIAWGTRVRWNSHFHVHHMDGNRKHNCRQNLLILDAALHTVSAKTARSRKKHEANYFQRHFDRKVYEKEHMATKHSARRHKVQKTTD